LGILEFSKIRMPDMELGCIEVGSLLDPTPKTIHKFTSSAARPAAEEGEQNGTKGRSKRIRWVLAVPEG
jgi:hypothetical protein